MRIGADFEEIGALPEGELVMKLPGLDIKMPYATGKAFVSNDGLGYVTLPIRNLYTARNGEFEGLMGVTASMLEESLKDPILQRQVAAILAPQDHTLFYSRARDDVEVITLPGLGNEGVAKVDGTRIICSYSNQGEVPTTEAIYLSHKKAIKGLALVTDVSVIEKEVLGLVGKANDIYDLALREMKKLGF